MNGIMKRSCVRMDAKNNCALLSPKNRYCVYENGISDIPTAKGGMDMLENLRIAVCGELPTACAALREEGVAQIDRYSDFLDLAVNLRKGVPYHLILVYAPQGEGLTEMTYPYKVHLQGDWQMVPVRMLGEPACISVLSELCETVHTIAGAMPRGRPAV